ncbi:hypothetical protein BDZ91DRAFT_548372 [Kalaharituber pfeilii]|nr:hypothetical protein BDZ91DRAFT_548372 [Kalaharituber pfeilii]
MAHTYSSSTGAYPYSTPSPTPEPYQSCTTATASTHFSSSASSSTMMDSYNNHLAPISSPTSKIHSNSAQLTTMSIDHSISRTCNTGLQSPSPTPSPYMGMRAAQIENGHRGYLTSPWVKGVGEWVAAQEPLYNISPNTNYHKYSPNTHTFQNDTFLHPHTHSHYTYMQAAPQSQSQSQYTHQSYDSRNPRVLPLPKLRSDIGHGYIHNNHMDEYHRPVTSHKYPEPGRDFILYGDEEEVDEARLMAQLGEAKTGMFPDW